MHDGSITFSTALDNAQLEKELSRLKTKVFKLEGEIGEKEYSRNILVERRRTVEAEINELKKSTKMLDGDSLADTSAMESKMAELRGQVAGLQKEIEKYDEELDKSNMALEFAKLRYGEIIQLEGRLRGTESEKSGPVEKAQEATGLAFNNLEQAFDSAEKAMAEQAAQRIQDIADSAQVADQRIVDLSNELSRLKVRVNELQAAGVGIGYEEYDKTSARIAEINNELREYQNNLLEVESSASGVAEGTKKAVGYTERFAKRAKEILASAFIFNILSAGLRQFTTWMGKAVKTNAEARASIAQLKGALLTLAQPLVEVVVPAFVTLVNVLTRIITVVAQLVSMLFGRTLKQSRDGAKALYNEANAIEGVGAAAKEAAGSLAGFDEINTINAEDPGGSGGGAGSAADIAPDFSWADDMGGMLDRLKEIADLVGLIAAGLALWKIGSMLPGVLGKIAQLLGGILMTVGGLLLFWNGLTDAWENGVDWLNLIEMIGGLAAVAFGLYTIFELLHPGWGKIAAGIALVVGGIAMLVTGFHDAMENGWNLQNLLLSIAGIFATGLGISLLTGSWIPLLIAGIASILLALTVATGHGEELLDGIRSMLEGFIDFFTGVFTGDMEKAIRGIEKIFDGLKTSVFAIVNGVKDAILSFLDWLDEKTGGRFHGIIETAKGLVTGFFDSVNTTLGDVLDAVKQIFTGITQFLTGVFTQDWDMAWEGVKNIFKGAWNGVVALLEGAVNLIVKGVNWLISQMNKIKFDVPSWVPGVGGKSLGISIPSISEVQIPRLAKGAVIPPNREFMAVLGDQHNGNNLELPESLLRQIVREESGGGSAELVQMLRAILNAVKEGHIIMVDGTTFGRTAIRTINSVNTAAGKQLLLI